MFRVLIVDDEPYIRQGLKIIIPWEEYGFQISGEASNGLEAIEKLKESTYDLIITDIKMPSMNGLDLMEYTWRNISTNVRCILLSGYYEFEYAKQAIKYEAMNYLLKPVDKSELIQALMEYKSQFSEMEKFELRMNKKNYHMDKERLDNLIRFMEEQQYDILEKYIEEIYYLFKYSICDRDLIQIHMDYLFVNLVDLVNKISTNYDIEVIENLLIDSRFYEIADLKTNVYLKKFIMGFAKYIGELRKNSFGGVLRDIIKDIHKNYGEQISLKSLSEKYYVNRAYLGQIFKKQYGLSFKDYLNQYRIEKAVELLKRTEIMVCEISMMVGFNSTDYFISKFVEIYQVTPLQYRKQMLVK